MNISLKIITNCASCTCCCNCFFMDRPHGSAEDLCGLSAKDLCGQVCQSFVFISSQELCLKNGTPQYSRWGISSYIQDSSLSFWILKPPSFQSSELEKMADYSRLYTWDSLICYVTQGNYNIFTHCESSLSSSIL